MIYVINFADKRFAQQQHDNTLSAYEKGKADKVIEYHPEDIDEEFIKANPGVFSFMDRGYGLWIWKSYFILKTLNLMTEDDYLFYCDSGSYFVNDIHHLIRIMDEKHLTIMPFELPFLEMQWTKLETYKKIGITDFSRNQVLATFILIKKSKFSVDFFTEWKNYMCDLVCSSPEMQTDLPNFANFISHREDQAVFSLLVHKYGLEVFRDPSQLGDWPWLYKTDNRIILNIHPYANSPYPRILVSNRRVAAKKYRRSMLLKDFANAFGLFRVLYLLKHKLLKKIKYEK